MSFYFVCVSMCACVSVGLLSFIIISFIYCNKYRQAAPKNGKFRPQATSQKHNPKEKEKAEREQDGNEGGEHQAQRAPAPYVTAACAHRGLRDDFKK